MKLSEKLVEKVISELEKPWTTLKIDNTSKKSKKLLVYVGKLKGFNEPTRYVIVTIDNKNSYIDVDELKQILLNYHEYAMFTLETQVSDAMIDDNYMKTVCGCEEYRSPVGSRCGINPDYSSMTCNPILSTLIDKSTHSE